MAGCSSRAGAVRVQSAVRLWQVAVVGGGRAASCGAGTRGEGSLGTLAVDGQLS